MGKGRLDDFISNLKFEILNYSENVYTVSGSITPWELYLLLKANYQVQFKFDYLAQSYEEGYKFYETQSLEDFSFDDEKYSSNIVSVVNYALLTPTNFTITESSINDIAIRNFVGLSLMLSNDLTINLPIYMTNVASDDSGYLKLTPLNKDNGVDDTRIKLSEYLLPSEITSTIEADEDIISMMTNCIV